MQMLGFCRGTYKKTEKKEITISVETDTVPKWAKFHGLEILKCPANYMEINSFDNFQK